MAPAAPLSRRFGAGCLLLGAALLVNGLIFGLAPWLVSETISASLPQPLRMVALFKPPPPPPPPEKELTPPDPPPAIRKLEQVKPRSLEEQKPRPRLEIAPLQLELDARLKSGPALPAPPPGPKPAMGKLDRGPLVASRVPPLYPYLARQRGLEGWVKVRFVVTPKGKVAQLSVLAAKPQGYFEESVMRSVSRWRFKPALKHGQAQEAWVETVIRFELQ